jgi:hypothetical protein
MDSELENFKKYVEEKFNWNTPGIWRYIPSGTTIRGTGYERVGAKIDSTKRCYLELIKTYEIERKYNGQ